MRGFRMLSLTLVVSLLVAAAAPVAAAPQEPAEGTGDGPTSQGPDSDHPPRNSLGVFVGSELTEDGSTFLGGFGHEPSSHWIEIAPRQQHAADATIQVGVTENADIPGEQIEIPQVEETNRYISSFYSEYAGFPPPLTNGGLNEHGVAARDIWAPSRQELVEMTPTPQTGPNYSDLSRIAMERADSAEDAVDIVGNLINEHGYSTYGGNSHLFADKDEGWVFVEFAGGQGLWAAERIPADEVRVSYPGYIHEFPTDFQDNPNFKASDNLVDFAVEQGWWDPEGDEPFNLQEVYGQPFPAEDAPEDDFYSQARDPLEREEEIRELAPVNLEDMLALVRDPRWSLDRTGYGQVAHLRQDVAHDDLRTLWTAVTSAITTPYVPLNIGVEDVPTEFKQHRYLTKDSASTFLHPEYAPQEATRYATRVFKRLLYYTCDHPDEFYRPVTAELEAFETEILDNQDEFRQKVAERLEAGEQQEARQELTARAEEQLLSALDLGQRLVDRVETQTREEFGISSPEGEPLSGQTWGPGSREMTTGWEPDPVVNCYMDGLDLPRDHGSYSDMTGQLLAADGGGPQPAAQEDDGGPATNAVLWALVALVVGLLVGAGVTTLVRRRR